MGPPVLTPVPSHLPFQLMGLNLSSITSILALPFSLIGVSFQDLGQVSCLQEGVYLVDLKQTDCLSFLQERWISRELWRSAKLATLGLPWWLRWQKIRLQYRRPGFNPWVRKIPLEKEMATHSSILACEIPRTVEPGRRQPLGLKRAKHN